MSQIVRGLHQGHLPRIPSRSTVTKVLHDRFGLSYRAFNPVKLRQYQAKFNDKRLWICRLLAQILSEDYLVVSIDESSFSTSRRRGTSGSPSSAPSCFSKPDIVSFAGDIRHRRRRLLPIQV